MGRIDLAEDRDIWVLVIAIMNVGFHKMVGIS